MAWVYGIVTNHGGGGRRFQHAGAGTSVRLYLPASRGIVRATAVSSTDLTGDQTILFVDDEDLLLTMGQMVLSSFGYTVLTANSGQKALEILSQSKRNIDMVITDLVMPNMSGRELTEHILRAAPRMRILWSSGYVRSPDAHAASGICKSPSRARTSCARSNRCFRRSRASLVDFIVDLARITKCKLRV